MYYSHRPIPSVTPDPTLDRGPSTDPNPGERSAMTNTQGAPLNSLGLIPARGNRAGGGVEIDLGARVGIMHGLEFSAGGRSHRISIGSFSYRGPWYNPQTGSIEVSSAYGTDSTVGPAQGNAGHEAQAPSVPDAGAKNDTSTGDTSPSRRRDTKTP